MADAYDRENSPDQNENKNEKLLKLMRRRFKAAEDSERAIRDAAKDDLKFAGGEQWSASDLEARKRDSRPCLTINRQPGFIHQITNDIRQNRPAIKVSPVDDKADIETAKVFQGVIRNIERNSHADLAYDTAADSAVRCSFGYIRVVTEYIDPMSFDQDIKIKRVKNRFSAYLDPSYQEPDGSDANYGFAFEDMPRDEFKEMYPDAKACKDIDWENLSKVSEGWLHDDKVRHCEYFYKEYRAATIWLLSDGSTIEALKAGQQLPIGVQKIKDRETVLTNIRWVKSNGVEILEETDWLGSWIPIIPVLGEELDIEGQRVLESIVRHNKDAQRMYNYMASAETEAIALAPKAPWVMAEGQDEGNEEMWRTANTKSHSSLKYKPKALNGQPLPPPQRNVVEPATMAITNARRESAEDMKATTGIYDAALGNRSNENSGIAIQRRNVQAQTSNFHFVDNLHRSIRHIGRILVELIPKIYDAERAVRILGEDDEAEIIFINKFFERNGKTVRYDLGRGRYDVAIAAGPSFETRRQETAQSMLELSKSVPALGNVAPDLLVKNLDFAGADEIAERLKKTIDPKFLDDGKQGPQDVPPQFKAQMEQMGQMLEQTTKSLHEAKDREDNKILELESKERIEMAKIQSANEIAMLNAGSREALALLNHQVQEISQRMQLLNASQPIENEVEQPAGPVGAAPANQSNLTGETSPGLPME